MRSRAWAPFLLGFAVLNYLSPRTFCWHVRRVVIALGPAGQPALAAMLLAVLVWFWNHLMTPIKNLTAT